MNTDKKFVKRTGMAVFGIVTCAISVGLFKLAALGVDPFQSFMAGLDALIPIPFGTLYVIANVTLLLFSLIFDRHRIGLGTFINLFLTGYVVQFSYDFFQKVFGVPSMPARVVFLLIAIVIMCFSSAFYFTAAMGVSTYDAVALILAENWHIGKFKYIRITTDIICVAAGCVLYLFAGGKPSSIPTIAGIGTIITAFFMGPLIDYFNTHVAKPFLEK